MDSKTPPPPYNPSGNYPPPPGGYPQQPAYPPPGGNPQQPAYPPPGGYPQQPGGYPPQPGGYPQQPGDYPQQPGGYPPPSGGYPQQPAAGVTVVTTQPKVVVVNQRALGPHPCTTTCPNCSATITTGTSHETGALTWIIAGVLCVVGCWPCCLIPFCVNECKDVMHTCPNCNYTISRYKRIS